MSVGHIEFSFGEEFQCSMLALMTKDASFSAKVLKYIPEERLYAEPHKYLYARIKEKIEGKGEQLTYVEVEDHLKTIERRKRKMLKHFCRRIYNIGPESDIFIKEKLTEYAKKNAFIDVFQTAQTLYNSQKYDESYTYTMLGINDLYSINFCDDAIIPIERFEEERQYMLNEVAKSLRRIPTNIQPLDDILRGGLEKGELGILLAEPKRGKSIGLIHMGSMAVLMRMGRVAHFVLEGTTEQAILRYLSRLSGIEYHRLEKDDITTEESRHLDMISNKYMKQLDLIPFNQHWNYTVMDIEARLKELTNAGRKPDLVVVDYADLLKSGQKMKELRHDQAEVYRDLKRLAVMNKYAIWTACLDGDTKIHTLHGHIPIKDLEGKSDIPVYAFNHDTGAVEVQTIEKVFKTSEAAEVWELELDNGEKIRMTPNHRLMLRSGEYRKLEDCVIGDSLMPLRIHLMKSGSGERKEPFVNLNNGERRRESHMVAEWMDGPLNGLHVHHKDRNYLNNHPDNLMRLSNQDHKKLHMLEDENWMHTDAGKKWWSENNPQSKPEVRERTARSMRKIWQDRKRLRVVIRSGKNNMTIDEIIAKAKSLPSINLKSLRESGLFDRVNRRLGGIKKLKELVANNHKIVAIRKCKVLVPTYNMTVSPSHNYALSAGIIVKNSQATRPKDVRTKEDLLLAKDIAESYEKVRIADLVITLNQTLEEKKDGILRFHIDIYRSNDTGKTIHLLTNFEKMVFHSKVYGFADYGDTRFEWMKGSGKRKRKP